MRVALAPSAPFQAATRTAAPQVSKPADPTPTPAPSLPLDLTQIDTPEKAALMPALNLLNYATFSSVVTACAMSNCGLHGSLAMVFQNADQQVTLSGQHSLDRPNNGIRVKTDGTIGNAQFKESWTYGLDEKIRIQGTIGNSDEDLTMTPDGKMDGHIGTVAVHLAFSEAGVVGTIGGKNVTETMSLTPSSTPNGLYQGQLTGTLGTDPVNHSLSVVASDDKKGISISGNGNVPNGYSYNFTQLYQPDLPS